MGDGSRRIQVRTSDPVPARGELAGAELGLASLPSVAVVVDDGGSVLWQIRLYAEIVPGLASLVGTAITTAVVDKGARCRTVALASCPGAKRWLCEVKQYKGYSGPWLTGDADVMLAACPDLLEAGVHAVRPFAEIVGQRWACFTGSLVVGANNISAGSAGQRIRAISAYTPGSGAVLGATLPSGYAASIKIPAGGAASLPIASGMQAPYQATVTNVDAQGGSWIVEYDW